MTLPERYQTLKEKLKTTVPSAVVLHEYVTFMEQRTDVTVDRLKDFFTLFDHWLERYISHPHPEKFYRVWVELVQASLFVYETSTLEKALTRPIVHRARMGVYKREDFMGNNRHKSGTFTNPFEQFKTIPQKKHEEKLCRT